MEQAHTGPDDFPTDGVQLSHFLVVSNYARSLRFYREILGATLMHELPGTLGILTFRDSQILLSAPRVPMGDIPANRPNVISDLTIRVPRCLAAYEVLRSRGAEFITPPFLSGDVVRAFFQDPDGHLLEIAERRETGVRLMG